MLNFNIESSAGRPVVADFYCSIKQERQQPLIIFCHGYKGFKDWGHFNLLPQLFNGSGFHFLKFNFSHNGCPPENPAEFMDLEGFALNNYSREFNDIHRVLNWALGDENPHRNKIDDRSIYLLGHSRGGSICILTAANDSRISKLVT